MARPAEESPVCHPGPVVRASPLVAALAARRSVSGVGDQARSFSETLGGGKTNEGVVATKGTHLVLIDATYTPASLAQVEALVSQLL